MDFGEKKEHMKKIQEMVNEMDQDIHLRYERLMINGLKLSVGSMVEFYTIQEKDTN